MRPRPGLWDRDTHQQEDICKNNSQQAPVCGAVELEFPSAGGYKPAVSLCVITVLLHYKWLSIHGNQQVKVIDLVLDVRSSWSLLRPSVSLH